MERLTQLLPMLLLEQQYGSALDMSGKPLACLQHRDFIGEDIDGFVEQNVFRALPRFFLRQLSGQFALARLQAIVPERGALLRGALLAAVIAGIFLCFTRTEAGLFGS